MRNNVRIGQFLALCCHGQTTTHTKWRAGNINGQGTSNRGWPAQVPCILVDSPQLGIKDKAWLGRFKIQGERVRAYTSKEKNQSYINVYCFFACTCWILFRECIEKFPIRNSNYWSKSCALLNLELTFRKLVRSSRCTCDGIDKGISHSSLFQFMHSCNCGSCWRCHHVFQNSRMLASLKNHFC